MVTAAFKLKRANIYAVPGRDRRDVQGQGALKLARHELKIARGRHAYLVEQLNRRRILRITDDLLRSPQERFEAPPHLFPRLRVAGGRRRTPTCSATTLAAAEPQHAARSSDSPLARLAMKPPQNAFPHPVTSASAPDWSSLKKAGTRHVSPVSASCATAPFAPRRTHTILAPAAGRRHSSGGEPSPTRDTASSSFGEKTFPAEGGASSVSRGTGRVACVNDLDAEPSMSFRRSESRVSAAENPLQRRGERRVRAFGVYADVERPRASVSRRERLHGAEHGVQTRVRGRAACVRRPSRSAICHARGVEDGRASGALSFRRASSVRGARRTKSADAFRCSVRHGSAAPPLHPCRRRARASTPSLSTLVRVAQHPRTRAAYNFGMHDPRGDCPPKASLGASEPERGLRPAAAQHAHARGAVREHQIIHDHGKHDEVQGRRARGGRLRNRRRSRAWSRSRHRFPRTRGTRRPAASPVARPRRSRAEGHARDVLADRASRRRGTWRSATTDAAERGAHSLKPCWRDGNGSSSAARVAWTFGPERGTKSAADSRSRVSHTPRLAQAVVVPIARPETTEAAALPTKPSHAAMAHEPRRFTNSDGVGDVNRAISFNATPGRWVPRSTRRKRPFPLSGRYLRAAGFPAPAGRARTSLAGPSTRPQPRRLASCSRGARAMKASSRDLFPWRTSRGPRNRRESTCRRAPARWCASPRATPATFALDASRFRAPPACSRTSPSWDSSPTSRRRASRPMAPRPTGRNEKRATSAARSATRSSHAAENSPRRGICHPRVYTRGLGRSDASSARGRDAALLGCAAAFRASSRRLRCGCRAARASPSRCSRGLAHVRAHRDWRGCRAGRTTGASSGTALRRRFRRRGVRLCAAGHRRVIVQKRRLHRVRRAPLAGAHRAGRDAFVREVRVRPARASDGRRRRSALETRRAPFRAGGFSRQGSNRARRRGHEPLRVRGR